MSIQVQSSLYEQKVSDFPDVIATMACAFHLSYLTKRN